MIHSGRPIGRPIGKLIGEPARVGQVFLKPGNFYVTVTTYRHLMLYTSKDVHPVTIGPPLIHHKKGFHSYFPIPFSMVRYNKELVHIKCLGTDGEVNVSDALQSVFTGGYHLLCDIHTSDN